MKKPQMPEWLTTTLRVLSGTALGAMGVVGGLYLLLMTLFMHPMVAGPTWIIAVTVYVLLVLAVAGQRKKRWFRRLMLTGLALVLGSAGCIGYYSYTQSIPTVEDRWIQLSLWEPFRENTRAVTLPEESTLLLPEEEALTLRIDGATALYPVYASFVRNTFEPAMTDSEWPQDVYSNKTLRCNGTNSAYERLIAGEADVIFCAAPSQSQRRTAEMAGLTLHMTPIGREAFVFFVNSGNPVTSLTVEQVQGIYAGEITNWKALGGRNQKIRAYQRREGSGSQTALQQFMAGKTIMEAPVEEVVADMGGVIRQVAAYRNHGGAIGYTFRFYANEMVGNDQIRLLALNGIEPTRETIRDGSYPIASYFYAVTASPIGQPAPEKTDPVLGAFLEWCQGEQGQWIVEAVGYVSVE